jgi:hypothetical protein
MLIANPIYDTVFKYLMENADIARGIISEIIGETIEHLEFKTRENVLKLEDRLTFYHLDFIAKIKQEDGGYKTVLIELQKSSTPTDIIRFRRYLGEQYKKEEEITGKHGVMVKEPLPIISIYILGYYLSRTLPGVIKVNRLYTDVLEGKEVKERNEFIECLTHDSYVIQIPALRLQMKTRLEYILSIFKQEKFIDDDHHLKSYDYEVEDELMKKILKQLEKAAANKELLQQLDLEEMALREFDSTIGRLEKELEQKGKVLEENKKALEEKDKALEENKKNLEEKDKALEEKERALEEKEKYIKELLKKVGKE